MRGRMLVGILAGVILAWAGTGFGQGCFFDDATFFTSGAKPNVMILLDRSGSMCWEPGNTTEYYPCSGYDNERGTMCMTSPYYYLACDAPYNGTNQYGSCSKIHLATQAIFSILDADSSGTVTDADSLALKVRLGYGHYYDSYGEGSGTYVPYNNDSIGSRYTKLWTDAQNEGTCGGTPLNYSLWTTKDTVKAVHQREGAQWFCRKNFVIVITDGCDTYGCGGGGTGGSQEERKAGANVAYTSFVHDTIPVFVVGFGGNLPTYLKNTLNWMAYCGGTRDPLVTQTGDTTAFVPQNTGTIYQTCGYNAADPGNCNLSGYAFIATNGTELRAALKAIFKQIQMSSGTTFSPPSVPANFTSGSMLLVNNFDAQTFPKRWVGHLKAYGFYGNGDIPVLPLGGLDSTRFKWDAGNILRARNLATNPRYIYTPIGGTNTLVQLNDTAVSTGKIRPETLGLASTQWDSLRNIVNYIYYDSTGSGGNPKFGWMGDPFHSGPVDVGPPNPYFSGDSLYAQFVSHHRVPPNRRPRVVYMESNDGLLHAFNGDTLVNGQTGGGSEQWALVPRHERPWLRDMLYYHDYNLDGPVVSTHILDTLLNPPISMGNWDKWRTILICGERTGGRYYYAMDVTWPESLSAMNGTYPKYLWECGPSTANGDTAMGYTFGKPTVCWILDGGARRHVAFLPGGYDCNRIGRGNFILALDADNGTLLKKISLGSYGVPAEVRPTDMNYDGYMDRLYVGDAGGNVWRIFLTTADHNSWWSNQLFNPNIANYNKPIFGQVSLSTDYMGNVWVFWGTGDRNNPNNASNQNKTAIFGLEDLDTTHTYLQNDGNIRNATAMNCNPSDYGWYVDLYQNATSYLEVFSNLVTVSDSVRVLGWSPAGSSGDCYGYGAGMDTLVTLSYTCGYSRTKAYVGSGIPPYELAWGVDRHGNVTALLPNLQKRTLGTLNRGKFIRVWREVY